MEKFDELLIDCTNAKCYSSIKYYVQNINEKEKQCKVFELIANQNPFLATVIVASYYNGAENLHLILDRSINRIIRLNDFNITLLYNTIFALIKLDRIDDVKNVLIKNKDFNNEEFINEMQENLDDLSVLKLIKVFIDIDFFHLFALLLSRRISKLAKNNISNVEKIYQADGKLIGKNSSVIIADTILAIAKKYDVIFVIMYIAVVSEESCKNSINNLLKTIYLEENGGINAYINDAMNFHIHNAENLNILPYYDAKLN